MAFVESSIQVRKTIEETFAFLNERESHLKFIPRILQLNQTSAGEFGKVGTTAKGVLRYFGVRIAVDYEIIEHQPGQRLAMKGQMGPVNFSDGYILSKNGSGAEIKFWLDLAPTGWARLFSPFMGWIGKIHAYETLRNLKRELQKIGG
ncbi:MAG TPA: SRPBCC family protein [Anaerolineales bacterium]|nr:SRPBCC family protein [Anaerolineales bacterium]